MFGKKQRQIEELTQKIEGLESILPFVPLAEEIDRRVTAYSNDFEASGNAGQYIDSLVPTLTEEQRVAYLRDIFQKMPFHEQLEVLERYYKDDETIRGLLAVQRQEFIEVQKRNSAEATSCKMLEELEDTAERHGLVELGKIGMGNTVVLDMLYMKNDKTDNDHFKTVRLTGRTMDQPGKVHVLEHGGYSGSRLTSDFYVPPKLKYEYILPHHIARIGTSVIDGESEVYEPTLYKGIAAPHLEANGKKLSTADFKLIRFAVNDTVVFDSDD